MLNVAVRYFSRGGNTKKLADTIAAAVGVEALTTDSPLTEDVDILFLGSSVYAYGVDDSVKNFIADNKCKIGKVVNFSTAAIISSTYKQVSKLLEEKNIPIAAEEYHCRGSFGPMHKGRPNAEDLKAASEFAKKVIG